MPSIDANGITIEYETTGTGEPLLLVMGLGGQLTDWPAEYVELLAEAGFQVIIFDNRDIGLSTEFEWAPPSQVKALAGGLTGRPPKSGYYVHDMASDAAALLRAVGIDSAHVVGMSMGGMIVQQMAIDHPGAVRSVTSIMSNTGDWKAGRPSPKLIAKFARHPEPTRGTAVDDSVRNFRLFSGPHFDESAHRVRAEVSVERSFRPTGTARQTAAIMASPDRTPRLEGVTAPTLVIHGLVDPLVRPSGGIATARAVPGSRLVMYPDMGHDLPEPRWVEMIGEILANAARAA
jgi:pimeloyl-ACP methyl ester carboxylesterase